MVNIKKINDTIFVQGPKGIQKIRVKPENEKKWIQRMVQGVTVGYKTKVRIKGVGYKAEKQEKGLVLALGYSNRRLVPTHPSIEYKVTGNGTIIEGRSNEWKTLKQNITQIVDVRSAAKDKYKSKGVA